MALFGESSVLGFGDAEKDVAGSGAEMVLTGEGTLAWLSRKETVMGREGRAAVVWKKDRAFVWDPSVKPRVEGMGPDAFVNGGWNTGEDAMPRVFNLQLVCSGIGLARVEEIIRGALGENVLKA